MRYPVLSSQESKNADLYTIHQKGIPSLTLMERAGKGIYDALIKRIKKDDKILVLASSGGNGGDGYVVSRYLYESGYNVKVLAFGEHYNEECKTNKERYKGEYVENVDGLYDVYVDALFGSGLSKPVSGAYYEAIEKINKANGFKVSIDIPSGLNGTNGTIMGIAFDCDLLLSVEYYKSGFFLNEGISAFKELVLLPIGLCVHPKDKKIYYLSKEEKDLLFNKEELREVDASSYLSFASPLQVLKEDPIDNIYFILNKKYVAFKKNGRTYIVDNN